MMTNDRMNIVRNDSCNHGDKYLNDANVTHKGERHAIVICMECLNKTTHEFLTETVEVLSKTKEEVK